MHKLDRQSVAVPACLSAPPNGRKYENLNRAEKGEIRTRLLEVQKDRCAYCERRTGQGADDGHIEHFRNQANHPHLDLEWHNMFWSCVDQNSCGKHKDDCNIVGGTGRKRAFNIDDIIDPTVDDPDAFFLFVYDGTAAPRPGVSGVELRRAEETLRVFNLADSAFLKTSREDAVRPYKDAVDSLLAAGPDVVKNYVQAQLPIIEARPFSTAIKHYLGGILS